MNLEIYEKIFGVINIDLLLDLFYNNLVDTNRSFDFFVNWEKIYLNFERFRIELNILNSLIGNIKFDETLKKILSNYPNILPVIPLLLAIRDSSFYVINDMNSLEFMNYNFSIRNLSSLEIEDFIDFFKKTGLKNFFLNISQKSIPDYYIGIEVGLDTHARKNRSGTIMENFILNKLMELKQKTKDSFEIITQKKYNYLKSNYGYNITSALSNRKADFLLVKDYKKIIAIETNFYSETGSKPQEIVNSYIQRQNELKKLGIEFIWVTDGHGWKKQQNQMNFAFERLDYILNIDFIKKGLLEEIIMSI